MADAKNCADSSEPPAVAFPEIDATVGRLTLKAWIIRRRVFLTAREFRTQKGFVNYSDLVITPSTP
ncbi:hypothetical protein [Planctomycetes bacterium Pan216]